MTTAIKRAVSADVAIIAVATLVLYSTAAVFDRDELWTAFAFTCMLIAFECGRLVAAAGADVRPCWTRRIRFVIATFAFSLAVAQNTRFIDVLDLQRVVAFGFALGVWEAAVAIRTANRTKSERQEKTPAPPTPSDTDRTKETSDEETRPSSPVVKTRRQANEAAAVPKEAAESIARQVAKIQGVFVVVAAVIYVIGQILAALLIR